MGKPTREQVQAEMAREQVFQEGELDRVHMPDVGQRRHAVAYHPSGLTLDFVDRLCADLARLARHNGLNPCDLVFGEAKFMVSQYGVAWSVTGGHRGPKLADPEPVDDLTLKVKAELTKDSPSGFVRAWLDLYGGLEQFLLLAGGDQSGVLRELIEARLAQDEHRAQAEYVPPDPYERIDPSQFTDLHWADDPKPTPRHTTISQSFAAECAGEIAETIRARGHVYAPPEVNFAQIAEFWRMWMRWRYNIDVPLNAGDVGIMQAGIKLSRHGATPTHKDTVLDMAAYILLAGGCALDAVVAEQGD